MDLTYEELEVVKGVIVNGRSMGGNWKLEIGKWKSKGNEMTMKWVLLL